MKLPVIFHSLAEAELNDAAAYYEEARPKLGEAFLAEVQHVVDRIASFPLSGRAVEKDIRFGVVKRFPYNVLYRVRDDHIRILAIAHQKRRPFYWHGRR